VPNGSGYSASRGTQLRAGGSLLRWGRGQPEPDCDRDVRQYADPGNQHLRVPDIL